MGLKIYYDRVFFILFLGRGECEFGRIGKIFVVFVENKKWFLNYIILEIGGGLWELKANQDGDCKVVGY